ncbi:MAG: hypothetical protein R3A52_06855 [Polyangiales bacterium]
MKNPWRAAVGKYRRPTSIAKARGRGVPSSTVITTVGFACSDTARCTAASNSTCHCTSTSDSG